MVVQDLRTIPSLVGIRMTPPGKREVCENLVITCKKELLLTQEVHLDYLLRHALTTWDEEHDLLTRP